MESLCDMSFQQEWETESVKSENGDIKPVFVLQPENLEEHVHKESPNVVEFSSNQSLNQDSLNASQ